LRGAPGSAFFDGLLRAWVSMVEFLRFVPAFRKFRAEAVWN